MLEKNIDWKAVGDLVRTLREQRGISYRALAEQAGVSRGVVLRLEAGQRVHLSTLTKLEHALNLIDGVLLHSQPVVSAPYFVQDPGHKWIAVRPNPNYTKKIPEYSQELLNDPAERVRIGKLGIVSCFQWESDLGLMGARMRGTVMELHNPMHPNWHEGEEMVFGVRGTTRITIGEESFALEEFQVATFWPKISHVYAPDPKNSPSVLLSIRIDTVNANRR